MRALRLTLITIGIFQLVLGGFFLVTPSGSAALLGLGDAAPPWASWLLAMMAARFFGYAYGMFAAARAPRTHLTWINTMIGIQMIDWVATIVYLSSGDLSLRQVSTAAFMPVLFVAALAWFHPRRRTARA